MSITQNPTFRPLPLRGVVVMMTLAIGCMQPGAGVQVAPQPPGAGVSMARESGNIRIVPNEAERRIDILVDNELFTAYIYPDPAVQTLKKPVLHPIITAKGHDITRGFPKPRAGDRVDHPHHVGIWFTFGDINGLDFWGYSDATSPDRRDHMGTIEHRETRKIEGNVLEVTMDWVKPDGKVLLQENTRFIFHAGPNMRAIDRITTLTALEERAVFNDTKEGMTGIRVTRALEHPTDRPIRVANADGSVTEVPILNNEGVTGEYLTSAGLTGGDAWGTRAHWVALRGIVEGEPVAVIIFDHPKNVGYPTYWHARTYGLFTANPFGRHMFTDGAVEKLDFALEPGESTTFHHRHLIYSGETTQAQIEAMYQKFVAEMP